MNVNCYVVSFIPAARQVVNPNAARFHLLFKVSLLSSKCMEPINDVKPQKVSKLSISPCPHFPPSHKSLTNFSIHAHFSLSLSLHQYIYMKKKGGLLLHQKVNKNNNNMNNNNNIQVSSQEVNARTIHIFYGVLANQGMYVENKNTPKCVYIYMCIYMVRS